MLACRFLLNANWKMSTGIQFQPGDAVRCRQQNFGDGAGLTAYEAVALE